MTGASKCLWEKLGLRPKPCAPRAKTFLGRKVLDSKELYPKNAILFLQSFLKESARGNFFSKKFPLAFYCFYSYHSSLISSLRSEES